MTPLKIREAFEALKQDNPRLRARNVSEELGIPEGQLLAAQTGNKIIRLQNEMQEILTSLEPLGEVMALTRNGACVHERKGVYTGGEFSKHGPMTIGLFNTPDIDLRLFMMHWKHVFSVEENDRHSLQFFNKAGEAVHKIYLTDKSDKKAYNVLVDRFKSDDQSDTMVVEAYETVTKDLPDNEINWDDFRKAWKNMRDVHNFFPMLRKFKTGREQAFRKVGTNFAYEVDTNAARRVLDLARDRECEIMVFVGNKGCIQIHTGPVKKLVEHGPWYNVLDPEFNLHLNEEDIARIWVTKKPTDDGIITAVEVFDKNSELIVTFFGKRKPGQTELSLWREIVDAIPAKEAEHAA